MVVTVAVFRFAFGLEQDEGKGQLSFLLNLRMTASYPLADEMKRPFSAVKSTTMILGIYPLI